MNWYRVILVGARLLFGYILAVISASILFAGILILAPLFDNELAWVPEEFINYALASALLGAIFGLPFTVFGSLIIFFLAPRNKLVFLLIGMFGPSIALILLLRGVWSGSVISTFFYTLPPGLLAAYIYGAIGFGYGFGRWKTKSKPDKNIFTVAT